MITALCASLYCVAVVALAIALLYYVGAWRDPPRGGGDGE